MICFVNWICVLKTDLCFENGFCVLKTDFNQSVRDFKACRTPRISVICILPNRLDEGVLCELSYRIQC